VSSISNTPLGHFLISSSASSPLMFSSNTTYKEGRSVQNVTIICKGKGGRRLH